MKRYRRIAVLLACSLLVASCQPTPILYQVVEFIALSDVLRDADARVEIFERPNVSPRSSKQPSPLLAEFGIPELLPNLVGLRTARVTTGPVTIEHMHTETYSWSWCMSVWAFVNDSDHALTVKTAECTMLGLDEKSTPRKPYEITQRLNGKTERTEIVDGKPLGPQESQRVADDSISWPEITIPPKSKTAVAFSYQMFHTKKAMMDIALYDSNSGEKYHYQFKLSK